MNSPQQSSIQPESGMTPRFKGLLKFIVGLPIAVVASIWVANQVGQGKHPGPHVLIGMTLPGALALAGLLEFVTAAPLSQLAARWDQLKGWQRGVIGTSICLALLIAFSFFGALYFGR